MMTFDRTVLLATLHFPLLYEAQLWRQKYAKTVMSCTMSHYKPPITYPYAFHYEFRGHLLSSPKYKRCSGNRRVITAQKVSHHGSSYSSVSRFDQTFKNYKIITNNDYYDTVSVYSSKQHFIMVIYSVLYYRFVVYMLCEFSDVWRQKQEI